MRNQRSGGSASLAAPQVNPFQPFPQAGGFEQSLYPANSRYHTLQTLSLERDGKQVAYLERRFLPDPATLDELHEHTVVQEDRLDNLAYKYFGDPELAWRIADANLAFDPRELTAVVGRRLRITLPSGIPGASRA